jgi:hypothetical protein
MQKNALQDVIEPLAQPHLLQHCLQQLRFGSSPDASQLMNRLRKCGVVTQWSFIQP